MVLLLIGMRSNSCRERVVEVLRRVNGVKDVSVSLIRARAIVLCGPSCGATDLLEAVKKAGYRATVEGAHAIT